MANSKTATGQWKRMVQPGPAKRLFVYDIDKVRQQFSAHIANGRAAVGFEFDDQGTYLLEPYED
jgi:hypothetical protein